jgi:hypothetical protein
MTVTWLDYALWFLAPAVMLSVLFFMSKRKLRTEFSMFFTYMLLQILLVAINFFVYKLSPDDYFFFYWTGAVLSSLLGFFVIHETFTYLIRPYPGLRDFGSVLFRGAVFLMLLTTGISALGVAGAPNIIQLIVDVQRAVSLFQCGLLLFVVLCFRQFGLRVGNFAFGIAMGFGLFAATDLIVYNVRGNLGPEWGAMLGRISTLMYNLAVFVWFGYSVMPSTASERNELVYHPTFDRWNEHAAMLMNTVPSMSTPSYLTDIEQTVDKVLAQSSAKVN